VGLRVSLLLATLTLGPVLGACAAHKDDYVPAIPISPGAEQRIAMMDRFRHHGSPKRLVPRVTVEVDMDEPPVPATEAPAAPAPGSADGDTGTDIGAEANGNGDAGTGAYAGD